MEAIDTASLSLAAVISRRLGLVFAEPALSELGRVLRERMRVTGCQGPEGYLQRLQGPTASRGELRVLAERLTVPETSFFRHPDQFRVLSERALPDLLRVRSPERPLRILSAGCSSGEEPYSIAMLVREAAIDPSLVQIAGVDVSAAALARARRAHYSDWSLRGTPKHLRARYFTPEGRLLALAPEIRAAVAFEERNLLDDDPAFFRPGAFDVVFCRNVIMYFTPEAARTVMGHLARSLSEGGYLFLGPAETLRGLSDQFTSLQHGDAFFYQLRGSRETAVSVPSLPSFGREAEAPVPPEPLPWFLSIARASARIAALAGGRVAWPRGPGPGPGSGEPALPGPAPPPSLASATDLVRLQRFPAALQALRALPPEDRQEPEAQLLLAVVHAELGAVAEAERICREVLARDRLNAGAHYLAALSRDHAGDPGGARAHDQAAAGLDPTFAMPHLHLGLMAKGAGQLETAREEFRRAGDLLADEDSRHIVLFGGGFDRQALIRICRREWQAAGGDP